MNLRFWEKPEVTSEPRRLEIPAERVLMVREFDDAYCALPQREDRAAHYDLWELIATIHPETKKGSWELLYPSALRAEIVERFPNKKPAK